MPEWDPGPPVAFADHFESHPSYAPWSARFRMAWGPIFYRGRLDGSAKVIVIGQDPAADEDVARRILVGDAGQRLQGFLRKLGLVRSYAMVNTFLYGLKGQIDAQAKQISSDPNISNWRNQLLDMLATPQIEAILAFGAGAHQAVDLWPGATGRFVARLTHPSARDEAPLLANWNQWLPQLRPRVTPDSDGTPSDAAYGTTFMDADREPIPAWDLPFGVPRWLGHGDTAVRVTGKDWITWKATAPEG
jgi:uracil-DNA glycosylase